MEIWIKKTLTLLKGSVVITENILLLKYQKQATTAALNGEFVEAPSVTLYCYSKKFTDQE